MTPIPNASSSIRRARAVRHRAVLAVLCLVGIIGVACGGDNKVAPVLRSPDTTLGTMHVAPLNSIMAVGDTLSLAVVGQTLSGAPITSFDSVEYLLQNPVDSLRLHVSSTGVMTALTPSSAYNPVTLQVIAFKDGLARADVAIVQITDGAFAGATLSIQPTPDDSARLAIGNDKWIQPTIQNTSGQAVDGPMVRYEYGAGDSTTMQCYVPNFMSTATLTSNQLTLTPCGAGRVGLNTIHGNITGTAWVIADVTVYGVRLRDSVQYTLTHPATQFVQIFPLTLGLSNAGLNSVIVAPGGTVYFSNGLPSSLGASMSWTFDHPEAVTAADPPSDLGGASGNISAVPGDQYATRRFPTAGTYTWTATVSGGVPPFTGATTSGFVIVQ